MVLAIDASRAAGTQKTGVGWYCHHLLAHLKNVVPHDVRVVLYTDRPLPEELRPWPEHWEEQVLQWPPQSGVRCQASGVSRWPLWSQVRLAAQVLRDRPDALFVPAHVIPELFRLRKRSQGPFRLGSLGPFPVLMTTIHDIAFKELPGAYALRERWYADHATRLAVRHADRIIVPTEAVRRDLEHWYGACSERIVVIYHGVAPLVISTERGVRASGEISGPIGDLSTPLRSARDDEEGRTVLYVGRLEYKKNVARFVEAFDRIASTHPDLQLVLAGGPGHGHEAIAERIARSPNRDRIRTPGWVDHATYRALLASASVFCFPTLAEGFGLPILEAMAAGVPVVTSRGHAHEEVAGDAAILVDPTDADAIARGISQILTDASLRADLVRRGQQRAGLFTWQRSAQATWEAIRGVLSA